MEGVYCDAIAFYSNFDETWKSSNKYATVISIATLMIHRQFSLL